MRRLIEKESALSIDDSIEILASNDIDEQIHLLVNIVKKAIEASTLYSKYSSKMKASFTDECKRASRKIKKLRRRYQRNREEKN